MSWSDGEEYSFRPPNAVMRCRVVFSYSQQPEEFFGAIPIAARLAGECPRLVCPHPTANGWVFFEQQSLIS